MAVNDQVEYIVETPKEPTILGPLGKWSKAKTAANLNERFEEAAKRRRPFENHWYDNIEFVMGRQWMVWDSALRTYLQVDEEAPLDYLHRRVHNITASTQEALIAHVTRSDPQPSAEPRTGEEEDTDIARIVLALLKWLYEDLNWREKQFDFLSWLFTCDCAYLKWGWDSTRSPVTPEGLTSSSLLSAIPDDLQSRIIEAALSGRTKRQTTQLVKKGIKQIEDMLTLPIMGDVFLDVVNPFEIFMEPNATDFNTAAWFFHAIPTPRSVAENRFGKKTTLNAQSAEVTGDYFPGFSRERMTTRSLHRGEEDMPEDEATYYKGEDYVYILEYWERPSIDYPRGRRTLLVGEEIIQDGPIPGVSGRPPFAQATYSKVLGKPSGQSLVERLKPIQIEYNRIISAIGSNLKLGGQWRLLIHKGSQVSELTDLPMDAIHWTGPQPPQYLAIPEFPQIWLEYLQALRNDAFEIAGLHSLSRGEYPPIQHALPGVAIQLLQERDDARQTPLYKRLDHVWTQAAIGLVSLVQQNYSYEQIVDIVGRYAAEGYESAGAVDAFKGSDIQRRVDVRMRTVSGLPDSPAAKRQYIFDMFQQGLFGSPADPSVQQFVRQLLEFPVDERMYRDNPPLANILQQLVMQRLAQGQMAQPQMLSQ